MISIGRIKRPVSPAGSKDVSKGRKGSETNFDQVLAQMSRRESRPVKISAHASARLRQRRIYLSGEDMERINRAVEKMSEKGARESLLLMRDLALLVNVKSRTVITALDGQNMRDKVFTNIDSAMII
ncbi:TPA: hypothetical protein EYP37_12375 [Candidatus Poribacteria bacterium]|nr:hypothetical protein [Candidatus Poribacteria bacterium]